MNNYPTINAKNMASLVSIVEQAAADNDYLDPATCPYDPGTIDMIRRILAVGGLDAIVHATIRPERGKVGRPSKAPSIPISEVEKEIDEIRQELGTLKIDGQTMETSDRIQVIKTRAALIERILGMKERIADVKRFHSFVTVVIGIIEEHVPVENREQLLMELKSYVE